MKPRQLLLLCAASVAAKEAISNFPGAFGICRSPSHTASPLFPDLAVCSRDGLVSEYDGVKSSRWTHSVPCYRNGSTEYCIFSSTSFADNRGVSILTTPKRAVNIARQAAFANPEAVKGVNQDITPDRPHVYRVVPMPGKGLGVVATKHLQLGDHIMSNTASIMVDYGAFEAVPEREIRRLQASGIDYLPRNHRSRIMSLSTQSKIEGHHKLVEKILATNAFDIDNDDGEDHSFYVVFPEISRMNHDCRPNADYHYDPDTLTQHIHAVRPIAEGEEITISYLDPIMSRKKRLDKLQRTWGFACGCSLCNQMHHMTKQSDSRLQSIREFRKEFHDYSTESRATPQMAELFVSLYQQERLDAMLYEALTYAALEWNGVGEPWTAVKWARLAIEHGLASVGPKDNDVVEMQKLVKDPWGHWSWMLRQNRRMRWGKDEKPSKKKEEEEEAVAEEEVTEES